MRLGIFGGTFDPVHYGHLLLAESCREQCRLDEVFFLPTAEPPHKQEKQTAPPANRVEMLELAIGGHPQFSVCLFETNRGGVNYTVDTLAHLQAEDPARELFFLMGADSLADLPTWREPGKICQLATLVIIARSGAPQPDLGVLASFASAARIAQIRRHLVEMPEIGLSASDLRRRVAEGRSIRYRTPRAVEMYIEAHGLYRQPPGG